MKNHVWIIEARDAWWDLQIPPAEWYPLEMATSRKEAQDEVRKMKEQWGKSDQYRICRYSK